MCLRFYHWVDVINIRILSIRLTLFIVLEFNAIFIFIVRILCYQRIRNKWLHIFTLIWFFPWNWSKFSTIIDILLCAFMVFLKMCLIIWYAFLKAHSALLKYPLHSMILALTLSVMIDPIIKRWCDFDIIVSYRVCWLLYVAQFICWKSILHFFLHLLYTYLG